MKKNIFKNIWSAFEKIASNTSQRYKIDIIQNNEDNDFFIEVVNLALNPFVRFHITGKFNESVELKEYEDTEVNARQILDCLIEYSKKRGVSNEEKDSLRNLIHQSGNYAIKVINRILDKDLKCGAAAAIFNKASERFRIPVHFPMKGISDIDRFMKLFKSENVLMSYKLDGTRCWGCVDNGQVTYLSFNGKELPNFNVFDEELLKHTDNLKYNKLIFDGEVVDANGDFTSQMTNFRRLKDADTSGFRFRIFDIIIQSTLFKNRYERMRKAKIPIWTPETSKTIDEKYKVSLLQHIDIPQNFNLKDQLQKALDFGLEGLMLKNKRYEYQMKRSNDWCKVKQFDTLDLRVVDQVEGTGKYKGLLGSLIVDYKGNEVEVGSGFSDEERKEFWNNPPKVIEVKYQEITEKGSLRFPVFMRVRDDKE